MGLDELAGCIEQLKARMQSHRTGLEENEIRTRMTLIDPLLCALRWDVSDPAVVIPEYEIDNKPADYTLLRRCGPMASRLPLWKPKG